LVHDVKARQWYFACLHRISIRLSFGLRGSRYRGTKRCFTSQRTEEIYETITFSKHAPITADCDFTLSLPKRQKPRKAAPVRLPKRAERRSQRANGGA